LGLGAWGLGLGEREIQTPLTPSLIPFFCHSLPFLEPFVLQLLKAISGEFSGNNNYKRKCHLPCPPGRLLLHVFKERRP
jgi:hypothetical protein